MISTPAERPAGSDAPAHDPSRRAALVVGLVSVGIYLVVVAILAVTHGGNAEWFVKFGTDSVITNYGREILGPDLVVPFHESLDGTSFWVQARDPLLVDPGPMETYTDRPQYRADRMLYPTLAAPFRLAGEQGLVWGLVIVNLGVVFAGGYLTARLAQRIGGPTAAGYAFAANPLVLASVVLDVADALAVAALVALVLAVRRERWGWAVLAGVAAVLTKEAGILVIAAVALGASSASLRRRLTLVGVPALVLAAWAAYVRIRVDSRTAGIEEVTVVPFGGFSQAWRLAWAPQGDWGAAFVAGLLVVVAAVIVVRWWQRRTLELWAALPFALLVPFLSGQVVHVGTNSVRAIGPSLTFLVLDVLAERELHQRVSDRPLRPPGPVPTT